MSTKKPLGRRAFLSATIVLAALAAGDLANAAELPKIAGTADIPVSTRNKGPIYGIDSGTIATDEFATKYPEPLTRLIQVLVRQAHDASEQGRAQPGVLFERFHDARGWADPAFLNRALKELKLENYWAPTNAAGLVAAR